MAAAISRHPYNLIDNSDATLGARTGEDVELRSVNKINGNENSTNYRRLGPPKPHFPWIGVTALLSIFLLTVASVGVLVASSGSPIDQWRIRNFNVQPQVWLSVLATIMNGVTVFALSDAATKTFWRTAARGTTLRSMNDLYESHFVTGALKNLARLRLNKVAVTSILCMVSALRGPLFQRASVVMSGVTRYTSGQQNLTVAQLIPPFYLYSNHSLSKTGFDEAYDEYLAQTLIANPIDYENCGDVCTGEVKGFGFIFNCSTSTLPWDESENSTVGTLFQDSGNRIAGTVPSFNSSAYLPGVTYSEDGDPDNDELAAAEIKGWFNIVNLFKTDPVCGGSLTIRTCSVHPAVVRYSVQFRNGSMSLLSDWDMPDDLLPSEEPVDPVLGEIPPWDFPDGYQADDWGPVTHWISWYMDQFNSEISISPSEGGFTSAGADVRFSLAKHFLESGFGEVNCSITFGDPTPFVINRLRNMAFRLAVRVGNVSVEAGPKAVLGPNFDTESINLTKNWTQTITLDGEKQIVTFSISIPYLIWAIIVSLLSVVALAPFYWNWKEVHVPLSFNPLDVANAFDAPLLQAAHQEKSVRDYVRKEHGLQRVRYSAEGSKSAEDPWSGTVKLDPAERQSSGHVDGARMYLGSLFSSVRV